MESEPNRLTELFVRKPKFCLSIALILCIVLSLVSFFLGFLKMNDLHERDFLIWDHDSTKAVDLINLANQWADKEQGILNEN